MWCVRQVPRAKRAGRAYRDSHEWNIFAALRLRDFDIVGVQEA